MNATPYQPEPGDNAPNGNERWYAVRTHPQREAVAQVQLRNQGFRTFLPVIEKKVSHARRIKLIEAPLFPRYLFVGIDLKLNRWRSVNGTYGVIGLITMGDAPTPAPKGVVEALIASSSAGGRIDFRPDLKQGQSVRLAAGPFAEKLGVLEHLDESGRVRVLLEIMGARRLVRLQRLDVVPAATNIGLA